MYLQLSDDRPFVHDSARKSSSPTPDDPAPLRRRGGRANGNGRGRARLLRTELEGQIEAEEQRKDATKEDGMLASAVMRLLASTAG